MDFLWQAVDVSWNTPRSDGGTGYPIMFWGSPGIGKSTILSKIAKELGAHLEVVILSVRDPSDVCGLPVKTKNGVSIEPPTWAKNIVKHNGGILFFDEMNCSPPAVQAAALRIVCERCVGDIQLPENTLIVAACNPTEEGANTMDLEPPLANRFCHFDISPDPELFGDWLTLGKSKSIDTNEIGKEQWDSEYSAIASVIAQFLRNNRHAIQGNCTDKIFASPRTWDMACRFWATCRCKNISAIPYLKGCVGEGFSKELFTFFTQMDLPNPKTVLESGVSKLPPKEKIDRLYASVNSVLSFVLKNQEHAPRFCKILQDIEIGDIVAQNTKELILNGLCNSNEALELLESLEVG